MSIGATTISHDTSFLLCASFISRSLKLLTTNIDNELCDSHKIKRVNSLEYIGSLIEADGEKKLKEVGNGIQKIINVEKLWK